MSSCQKIWYFGIETFDKHAAFTHFISYTHTLLLLVTQAMAAAFQFALRAIVILTVSWCLEFLTNFFRHTSFPKSVYPLGMH